MNGRLGPPRGTVAEGNFDHPVNGQKVNERAAGSAPLPTDPPSSTETQAFRSPFPQGKAFGLSPRQRSAFPGGKGDRSRKARVDEGCFRLTSASQLCYTYVTACILTRIYLAERLLVLTLSQFRASRGAGAGLLEICMHFSSSLRARAARLCVRPKNLSAARFARAFQPSPLGKGDRSRKARVDEGCFRLTSASQLCYTYVTACILTRIYLAERFSDVGLSQFRASRGAGAGLLEICMHFSSSLRARAARLCVRPNNLCAFRICSLGVRPNNFCASRICSLGVRPDS